MATAKQELSVVQEVKLSFWQTVPGILLKRLFFQAVAAVSLVLYNELSAGSVDWAKVQYALATQIVYIVLTFSRDVVDPNLPNSTNAVEVTK